MGRNIGSALTGDSNRIGAGLYLERWPVDGGAVDNVLSDEELANTVYPEDRPGALTGDPYGRATRL